MELNKNLKALLQREGINVSQLSKRTKIPVQTLHNWLSGVEPRSLKQVRIVSDYFNVSIDYLCFSIENKNETYSAFENEINAGIFEVVLRRIKNETK
ncbi:MAG: hypothetical protein A2381_13465 [Bdellovibrionales bacterium RIFOXYB1_FULL_37_110]|nr:MAG: hypothetical protein A2417_08125 [Bdellovibrionales bacterium RIFOXYC1_FULL_37_79]OFZ59454.1 MAG: hypothetical protein A2381_13465 [Bdellovibrionales bacterium RIFOXYB1_FULL_37_110]OFZ64301.1 MAG: hypothetical protein A2577_02590 [Bdellovibrionales bacterium RIFOXYD1_FULL_36_51]